MSGTLIFVSGVSGSGKTTLIGAALQNIPSLHYAQTVTTRPPRKGEADHFEYTFVNDAQYESRKQASAHWDHADYLGHKYGVDIAAAQAWLQDDETVVCAVAPDLIIINEMQENYGTQPVKIWIDTPAHAAKSRRESDSDRLSRDEAERVKNAFDFVFAPTGQLETDCDNFTHVIKRAIARSSNTKKGAAL
jgi:guanylate kinase